MINQIDTETAPSKGAIWDEFSEQHQHCSINKHHGHCLISTFLVLKMCIPNVHFSCILYSIYYGL